MRSKDGNSSTDARRVRAGLAGLMLAAVALAACRHWSWPRQLGAPVAPVDVERPLHMSPALDRVADVLGEEDGVRFLEFWEGMPDPLPGIAVGIDAYVFDDIRVAHKRWAAHTHVDDQWYGVLQSLFTIDGQPLLIVSSDNVATLWRIAGTIERPEFLHTVEALTFDSPTNGCVIMSVDETTDAGVVPGRFRACTKDGAKTWTPFERMQ